MTMPILPFELLNLIFSYMEGSTNRIMKEAINKFYSERYSKWSGKQRRVGVKATCLTQRHNIRRIAVLQIKGIGLRKQLAELGETFE